jgi:hypothetical protein
MDAIALMPQFERSVKPLFAGRPSASSLAACSGGITSLCRGRPRAVRAKSS